MNGTPIFGRDPDGARTLEAELWLPRSIDELWPFFADAANLGEITPPHLSFKIITPTPIDMKVGTLIDYRIGLRGIPLRWRTEITRWEPPHAFTDTQLRGPYRLWDHTHRFIEQAGPDGTPGTLCTDHVRYRVPFDGLLFGFPHWLMVKRDLTKIFGYRTQQLQERFGS